MEILELVTTSVIAIVAIFGVTIGSVLMFQFANNTSRNMAAANTSVGKEISKIARNNTD